eukprot:TRINITY_DN620_c0_g1_i1.p1 TRINITY_DN620_c0_g1~~TRINITY_DN620_c0_g1_i1.p1  ORF type:complete len:183 (+),score=28.41 TRINITY_DN620_c0_g1_i1:2-550(+)
MRLLLCFLVFFFFFSSRRRHTRFLPVSWARRCVQETVILFNQKKSNFPGSVAFPVFSTGELFTFSQLSLSQTSPKKQNSKIKNIMIQQPAIKPITMYFFFSIQFPSSCQKLQIKKQAEFSKPQNKNTQRIPFEGITQKILIGIKPVSYTHLTLPTKRIVQISVVAVSLKKRRGKLAVQRYGR